MSGNATKEETRRVTLEEHDATRERVTRILSAMNIPWRLPTQFSGKNSHGDIDIVVSDNHIPENFTLPEGKGQQSRNGFTHLAFPVIDNSGKETGGLVQVDLIRTPIECIEQTKTYLSHGTFGNLLGLVCRSIGMRYGMQGVTIIARKEDGTKCGDITVTQDPEECLKIIGMNEEDRERVLHGQFENREDHYPVLTRVPFFHHDCIHPMRMTAPNRGRDKKRPEVEPCREWILANVKPTPWDLPWRETKEQYLAHQAMWQKRLLGEKKYQELQEQAKEHIAKLTGKTGAKGEKGAWFETMTKLTQTHKLKIDNIGQVMYALAKTKNLRVDDFIKQNSPENTLPQLVEHLKQNLCNEPDFNT
jgi:hypothetical protein